MNRLSKTVRGIVVALLFVPCAFAADGPLSAGQRARLVDLYQVNAAAASKHATDAELAGILRAQDARVAVPSTLAAYRTYLAKSPLLQAMAKKKAPVLGALMAWNLHALDMTALDHTVGPPDTTGHEQFGPHRTSRAMAIVHLAMFEAVDAAFRSYDSYHGLQAAIVADALTQVPGVAADQVTAQSMDLDLAIAEAAHDTLVALYPKKAAFADEAEANALKQAGVGVPVDVTAMSTRQRLGYVVGKAAAKAVLADRAGDGSDEPEPTPDDPRYAADGPDRWHPDPLHPLPVALGGNWMHVRPFVIPSASAMRPAAEPASTSAVFVDAYKEVKRLGGDATAHLQPPRGTTPTRRTATQTFIGDFWAYDGTAFLCAPPRLYNEIATSIALHEKKIAKLDDMARYLVLVNVALADAGIAAWDAKYFYRLGRPVTYLRDLSIDGTAAGQSAPLWTPRGAPVSNGNVASRNFTPPFPSFPSGHAVFGGALFQVLRDYWSTGGTGEAFTFVSDEFNGKNSGPGDTTPRPLRPRHFASFGVAEAENARSRIYLGIHWQFDADVGVAQGNQVADYVFAHAFGPTH